VFFAAREAEGREAKNGYPAKNKFFVGLQLPYRNNRREFFCAAGSGTYPANGAFLPAGACRGNADEYTAVLLGCVSKITKAHFRRLDMHIFVEKPRRSTTAPAFIASICKPIQQNCIF
jgi:hypothetical protein